MPRQKPGKSKQNYGTPPELLQAVMRRLDIPEFSWDLAADESNKVVYGSNFYTESDNALVQPWNPVRNGWAWCNPPYAHIEPWVARASWSARTQGAHIAMLLPAGVGSNWWAYHVHNEAHVLLMHGRVTFVGADGPYPKDTALLLYSPAVRGGYEVWSWRD